MQRREEDAVQALWAGVLKPFSQYAQAAPEGTALIDLGISDPPGGQPQHEPQIARKIKDQPPGEWSSQGRSGRRPGAQPFLQPGHIRPGTGSGVAAQEPPSPLQHAPNAPRVRIASIMYCEPKDGTGSGPQHGERPFCSSAQGQSKCYRGAKTFQFCSRPL